MNISKESRLSQMELQALQDSRNWFPEVAESIVHHTLGLAGEVGEFANIVKKCDRGSLNGREPVVRHDLAMELTDVFIYVLNLAAVMGVDLEKTYAIKRAENVKRFGGNNVKPRA